MTGDPQVPADFAPVRLSAERDLSLGNLRWNLVRCAAALGLLVVHDASVANT